MRRFRALGMGSGRLLNERRVLDFGEHVVHQFRPSRADAAAGDGQAARLSQRADGAHNLVSAVIGASLLWGWSFFFGSDFNAGSAASRANGKCRHAMAG